VVSVSDNMQRPNNGYSHCSSIDDVMAERCIKYLAHEGVEKQNYDFVAGVDG
jgi:hypothetical protein